jgi:hypothetical protein
MRTDHFVDLEIWRDNIKIRFKEVGCENVNWMEWFRRVQEWAFVMTVNPCQKIC